MATDGAKGATAPTAEKATIEIASGLPLTDFQKEIVSLLEYASGRAKHCARNAIRHLAKSWEIRAIDKEMALFRAITAEEEAATAIFLTLKKYHYPHAQLLKHRDHAHKAALYPFLSAVSQVLEAFEFVSPQLTINPNATPPKIMVRLDANKLHHAPPGTPQYFVEPVPPLNWALTREDGEVWDFAGELVKVAEKGGFSKIIDLVKEEANTRNRLLYATDNGIPTVEIGEGLLAKRRVRVFVMLTLYLLIDQTPQPQTFVVQCLQAFLKIHTKFEADLSFLDEVKTMNKSSPGQT